MFSSIQNRTISVVVFNSQGTSVLPQLVIQFQKTPESSDSFVRKAVRREESGKVIKGRDPGSLKLARTHYSVLISPYLEVWWRSACPHLLQKGTFMEPSPEILSNSRDAVNISVCSAKQPTMRLWKSRQNKEEFRRWYARMESLWKLCMRGGDTNSYSFVKATREA